jgi:hypothetical protein
MSCEDLGTKPLSFQLRRNGRLTGYFPKACNELETCVRSIRFESCSENQNI